MACLGADYGSDSTLYVQSLTPMCLYLGMGPLGSIIVRCGSHDGVCEET